MTRLLPSNHSSNSLSVPRPPRARRRREGPSRPTCLVGMGRMISEAELDVLIVNTHGRLAVRAPTGGVGVDRSHSAGTTSMSVLPPPDSASHEGDSNRNPSHNGASRLSSSQRSPTGPCWLVDNR